MRLQDFMSEGRKLTILVVCEVCICWKPSGAVYVYLKRTGKGAGSFLDISCAVLSASLFSSISSFRGQHRANTTPTILTIEIILYSVQLPLLSCA